jgi:SAM-dependent methyltransferase
MWRLLLDRKVSLVADRLGAPAPGRWGLDLGCGLGHQCVEMARRGYSVVGVDTSLGLLRRARASGAAVLLGDALHLPFRDDSLDFVYAIGVLHHLPSVEAQDAVLREVARTLRPGGRLFVQETNTRNPLFRFYMGYVFPILKTIDEGTERWIAPDRWSAAGDLRPEEIHYFTFLPDAIPRFALPSFLALERRLEASRWSAYAVHYLAVLRKPAASQG